jgi:DNA-binding response OmpR family regulator
VLLVEDDDGIALPLRCSLERDGHRVERATTAADALARLREGGVSLVVVDVEHLDPDGPALAHQARVDRLAPAMLLLTSGARPARGARPQQGTLVSHLAKPFTVREFLARTRVLLRSSDLPVPAPRSPVGAPSDREGATPATVVGQVPQNVV